MVIIPLPLIGVAEYIVGLLDVLEYLGGILVLILVGMPLEGGLLVGSIDVLLGDIPLDVEELVVAGFSGL
jgi:hypothetical protein